MFRVFSEDFIRFRSLGSSPACISLDDLEVEMLRVQISACGRLQVLMYDSIYPYPSIYVPRGQKLLLHSRMCQKVFCTLYIVWRRGT